MRLYREIHLPASASCGSIVYDGAIDFLFIDYGNTHVTVINRSLVGISNQYIQAWFPDQTEYFIKSICLNAVYIHLDIHVSTCSDLN